MYKLVANGEHENHFQMIGTLVACVKSAIRLHARLGMTCGIYRQDGTEIREAARRMPLP